MRFAQLFLGHVRKLSFKQGLDIVLPGDVNHLLVSKQRIGIRCWHPNQPYQQGGGKPAPSFAPAET
jgi:hypothetical protein